MYLIFDTETTGLPKNYKAPYTDLDNWPRLVQLAWQLHDHKGNLLNAQNLIVKPNGFTIPFNAEKIHGISTERALNEGVELIEVMQEFADDITKTEMLIAHNIEFDLNILGAEFIRASLESLMFNKKHFCTKLETTDFVAIPGGRGGRFKWPTLTELHQKLFGVAFEDAHDAAYDVAATAKCFFGLLTQQVIPTLDGTTSTEIIYEEPKLAAANFAQQVEKTKNTIDKTSSEKVAIKAPYSHLHVHAQYSVLQSTVDVKSLIKRAKEFDMPAVGLTDHGNMYGAFHFVSEALKQEIKPIVGCEFYITQDRTIHKFTKENPDRRYNQVLIAKNKEGYHNLAKLSSIGFVEGYYAGYPRIDKEILVTYKEHLIATTGALTGEIPFLILNVGEVEAEKAFEWWLAQFGEDFYIELLRQGLEENDRVNQVLLQFAHKYQVKYFPANNIYYIDKEDSNAHDILLCVKDGELQSTPLGKGRGYRFGMPNDQFYFKSQEEMKYLFKDLPEAFDTLNEIIDKVEIYKLKRDVILPEFDIPVEFKTEDEFLQHLTFEGAKKRYEIITPEIEERLNYELEVIAKTGYPGYFLIVQDFTRKAREMGVSVGPGRGSAAGSAVAYCIGITNVDPIKYDLLFERFLNPDRVSLPDIDIDFDDEGREKVIRYVIDKYGQKQVAQIITYGKMAAKSAIRDAARVMELPLDVSNNLAKLVPERPGTSLAKAFDEVEELKKVKDEKNSLESKVINQAEVIEGSLRNTGIHACGVIITPDDITNFIPVSTAKDSDLLVTQFDNSVVESAGMLKMDFLGLKTLSIINTAVRNVLQNKGIQLIPDDFPLDDEKTYKLYQKGYTNGTFQFESPGMQKHLRALKPDRFEDLIAMNALYRPGPMEYIPNFIARKHGREEITYDIPDMEEYLKETYGITVYQEQVMLLSQKLANFTKGQADSLRKAMGKKIQAMMDDLKPKFFDGCKANGHSEKTVEKVWNDWEAFAKYAFNKSHSTCYSIIAYQTAYLKANYPPEYMASVLTHNQSNIEKVTFFMEECQKMGIKVLGPDVNESSTDFTVNKEGQIRFGLGAIKGTGETAVQAIIDEREENGVFQSIFEFAERINLRTVNKKTFESLALAGAFDNLDQYHRRQYVYGENGQNSLVDLLIQYGNKMQQEKDSSQVSLFGGVNSNVQISKPSVSSCEPFEAIEKLNKEKEVVGFYISGHPLDQYKIEIENFCDKIPADFESYKNKVMKFGGVVTKFRELMGKRGKPFGLFSIEDYHGGLDLALFGEEYLKQRHLLVIGQFLFLKGKVEERYNQPGLWEFKPTEVSLLGDVREKNCKEITLKAPLSAVDRFFIDTLDDICTKHGGTVPLKINISDEEEKIDIDFFSNKYKLDPSNELIEALGTLEEVRWGF